MALNTTTIQPRLLTELDTADIPHIYRRFAEEVVGANHWQHRVAQLKAEIRGNRFLSNYLHEENAIVFALDRCGEFIARDGRLPEDPATTRALYPAISFAAQVLSMTDIALPVEAERLRKRVKGALKNPDDMRGYRLELGIATHFARRGHKLEWPEMVGRDTFDLLVTDLAEAGMEVECKSISKDKGRSVHRHESLAFHGLLWPELASIRKSLRTGVAVVLTVPRRLPTRHADRVALAKRVRHQINIAQSERLDDGSEIRITEFDLAQLGDVSTDRRPAVVRAAIEHVTGTRNRQGMLIGTDVGGALAFVVQSAADDRLMEATFDTLSDAARRQLSGSRPGILIACFDGLDAEQLVSIAAQDNDAQLAPTALGLAASRFLSAEHRDHVVGLGLLSRSAVLAETDDLIDNGGAAYYFPKCESPFWHTDLGELFTWR